MIVPSRSRKTARDLPSPKVMLKACNQLIARHSGGSEFSYDDGASVIGDFRGFDRRGIAGERESKKGDSCIARAGYIEDLARLGRNMMWRLVLLKKEHTVLAKR